MKSIMLKANIVCFVDLWIAFDKVACVGIGNEEEKNTRSFAWISDESI